MQASFRCWPLVPVTGLDNNRGSGGDAGPAIAGPGHSPCKRQYILTGRLNPPPGADLSVSAIKSRRSAGFCLDPGIHPPSTAPG